MMSRAVGDGGYFRFGHGGAGRGEGAVGQEEPPGRPTCPGCVERSREGGGEVREVAAPELPGAWS